MKIPGRKKLIPPLILLMSCLGLLIFDQTETKEENILLPAPTGFEEITFAGEVGNGFSNQSGSEVISLNYPEKFPSPFALVNNPVLEPFDIPATGVPTVPQIPDNIPVLAAGFELPSMPPIGNNPGGNITGSTENSLHPTPGRVFLKAVLYKEGQTNMAILAEGDIETVVVEGTSSPFGYVSKISANTVIVGNKTLSLEI